MRIVHIAPNASFTEGWSYHENLLPKYQQRLGHKVTLIVVNKSRPNQELIEVPCDDFISKAGFRVIRRAIASARIPELTNVFSHMELYDILEEIKPDYIHFHGLVSNSIDQVVQYKKKINPDAIIVMDNHLDYNIGNIHGKGVKRAIVRWYYRWLFRKNKPYISKVYGVTPWRKQYAMDVFGVPSELADVLIMGADDEMLDFAHRDTIRRSIRNKYGVKETDFLIVTGGKIDQKKKIHLLMEACGDLEGTKLLVFGNVLEDVKVQFETLDRKYSNVIYVGWASAKEQYDYYFAADLVAFPGQHSVMWEQACAAKTPCLFARWEGMEHMNNGGNSDFIDSITVSGIRDKICELLFSEEYYRMKAIAESDATDIYLYSHIAAKGLEDAKHFYEHLEKNSK